MTLEPGSIARIRLDGPNQDVPTAVDPHGGVVGILVFSDAEAVFTDNVTIEKASGPIRLYFDIGPLSSDQFRLEALTNGGAIIFQGNGDVTLHNQNFGYFTIHSDDIVFISSDGNNELKIDGDKLTWPAKIGLFGVPAVAQQAHIADPAADTTALATAFASLLDKLEAYGLLATS